VAVDRNNFKTCDQSSFCKRQRAVAEGSSQYSVVLETVSQSPDAGVVVDVRNDANNVTFLLQLMPLEGGMLRLLMDEKNPLYPRFKEPYAVLEGNLKVDKTFAATKSGEVIQVVFGAVRAELRARPLQLSVFRDDRLLMTVNARGLLAYEHYRKRHQHPEPVEAVEGGEEGEAPPPPPEGEPEEPGMWEESFKGHTDSKPRGPASVGVDVAFVGAKHVYGIPEHADDFALKDTAGGDPYRLYNLDVFEYELRNPMALYASVPFMVAHSEAATAGLFWHSAAETWVDVQHLPSSDVVSSIAGFFSSSDPPPSSVSSHWMSESGIIDAFLLTGPGPMEVFQQYATVTGTTPLPPMFALAYHQCRWNYNDEADVKAVHEGFDAHDIPMDVMWLDIEHTDGKRYFTWDSRKFPHPEEMTNALSAKGRKLVTIVDPHIKRDPNYWFYEQNQRADHFIKTKDGVEFDGWCWPGSSSYLDMTNPKAREMYIQAFALDTYKGSTLDTFTWNDMNEPSVFNGPEVTLQKDTQHPGLGVEHREVHNAVAMLFHASTYEGQLRRSEGQLRPFVLTRGAFAGSQRTTAIWTGDNKADWDHLKISIPMLLSLSVSGLTHAGADIGGFFGNPGAELMVRWYQAAAYTPFMRSHAHLDSKRREPWLFDRQSTAHMRRAIRDHYRILPLWYTLFWEAETTGAPPMRPLWAEYPADPATFTLEGQYLIGAALLVAPVLEEGATSVQVYFPAGRWYDTTDNTLVTGPLSATVQAPIDKTPVFQRGGAIIARKERVRRSSPLMRHDPLTLLVALSEAGTAEGTLYDDDQRSMDYRKGVYHYMKLSFADSTLRCAHQHASSFSTRVWLERVVVLGLSRQPKYVTLTHKDGQTQSLEGKFSPATGSHASRLILRKPGVGMGADWSIKLHYDSA